MPERIQLKRARGWRLPEGAVNCSRPGRWGNCFKVGAKVISPGRWDTKASPYDGSLPVGKYDRGNGTAYEIRLVRDRADAVALFTDYFRKTWTEPSQLAHLRRELGGRDLACWCPPPAEGQPDICHAATLLALANNLESRPDRNA